ncbi:MAG: Uma2 family endonuclease [Chloroflexota bacterium]
MTIKTNHLEIEHYYDSLNIEIEGEESTQSFVHYVATQYLIATLEWFFNGKGVGVVSNVNFYQIEHPNDPPQSPDIAVVEGLIPEERTDEDYWIGEDEPPPLVVFEIASRETWLNDLETKPDSYAGMGIAEYFAFDPNEPSVWTGTWLEQLRLIGWRLDTLSGEYRPIEKDSAGRLWSEQLQSWLTVEDKYVRLYTREGELRLTGLEAQNQQAALERARAEVTKPKAALERAKAEAQAQRAEVAKQKAALELAKVEAQAQRAEAAKPKAALERAKAEAQAQRAEVAKQKTVIELAKVEAQAQRAEVAKQKIVIERARAEAQAQRAEVAKQKTVIERARAEAQAQETALERARVEKLLELLRQKGINPDDLI